MSDLRKAFLIAAALCYGLGVVGVIAMSVMEYQARQTLPPDLRSAEAIEQIYDGEACLGCGTNQIVIGAAGFIFGSLFLSGFLISSISEIRSAKITKGI